MLVSVASARRSDSDLIAMSLDGDRDAFAELYLRYHVIVYRFGRQMTGSNDMAADIVQDVFMAMLRNLSAYDTSRPLQPYLYGIARRITRRRLQRARRVVSLDDCREVLRYKCEAAFDHNLELRDDVRMIRYVITTLPSRYREVLVLCDLHKVSQELAAEAIGCAAGTVRSRLHRARRMVVDRMQRLHKGVGS